MAPQIKTEQEMFPLVEGWLESGFTQKQFCATHQMPVHILAYWVGRYRKSKPAKATADKKEATTAKMSQKVCTSSNKTGHLKRKRKRGLHRICNC